MRDTTSRMRELLQRVGEAKDQLAEAGPWATYQSTAAELVRIGVDEGRFLDLLEMQLQKYVLSLYAECPPLPESALQSGVNAAAAPATPPPAEKLPPGTPFAVRLLNQRKNSRTSTASNEGSAADSGPRPVAEPSFDAVEVREFFRWLRRRTANGVLGGSFSAGGGVAGAAAAFTPDWSADSGSGGHSA